MAEAHDSVVSLFLQSAITEWITTLGLIFGGCCSNAWALELATSQNPHAGSLITFAQFVLVSLYGFRKHLTVAPVSAWRGDLLRRLAARIIALHAENSRRLGAARLYVAIEGPTSDAFTDELAREIADSSHPPSVKRFTFRGEASDVLPQLHSLWSLDLPQIGLVLVHGDHLHASDFRAPWDYTVLLVSPDEITTKDTRRQISPPADSLTVDISSQTYPVVISPVSAHLRPLNLLTTLTRIRLKKRSIPISRWAIQVVLFLLTSLLNNAAFGYDVPMAVHIIFRSGGLVVNMFMGWLIEGRRYNGTQILSVILVTLGVVCTTLSGSAPAASRVSTSGSLAGHYSVGVMILTLALIMSGFMGLAQDRAYGTYGRGHWQEAMFYLHFLALPGFIFVRRDLASQIRAVNASTRVDIGLSRLATPLQSLVNTANMNVSFPGGRGFTQAGLPDLRHISVPQFYFPLMLNVVTQLVCVSGVHRLTSRVNSLTVTLVLVVRKAVSLGISVTLLKKNRGGEGLLWVGAGLVLAGTVGYALGAGGKADKVEKVRNGAKAD